jgi:hypothetical protein
MVSTKNEHQLNPLLKKQNYETRNKGKDIGKLMFLFLCLHKLHKVGPAIGCFMRFWNFYYIPKDLYYVALYYKYVPYRKECKATKTRDMSHLKNILFNTDPEVKLKLPVGGTKKCWTT